MNKPAYVITRKGIKHANRRKRGREPRHGQESLSARSLKPECFFLLFALCVAIFTFLNHHNFVPTFQLLNFRRANAGPTVETQPPTALYAYDERTMRALIDIGRRSNHRANSLLCTLFTHAPLVLELLWGAPHEKTTMSTTKTENRVST